MARLPRRTRQRYLDYPLQAAGVALGYGLLRCLPLDWASAAGGWLGRTFGPKLGISNRARRNLSLAMPDLDTSARDSILRGMWDNLGRTLAEYPHLGSLTGAAGDKRITVEGIQRLNAWRDAGHPIIMFSGHLGNWEILPVAARRIGLDTALVYRPPNNPHVAGLVHRARRRTGTNLVPKGSDGARAIVKALKDGLSVGILVDQKFNRGIPVPFFGHDAMTTDAVAHLARRFKAPLVPARVERIGGAHFRVTVYPALDLPDTGDRAADAARTMESVNAVLEDWISDHPEQWLWLHRRWPRHMTGEPPKNPR